MNRVLGTALASCVAIGCAKAQQTEPDATGPQAADAEVPRADASCGDQCDSDGDHVPDGRDKCPDTPLGSPVNQAGCADAQVDPVLRPTFPAYGLTWTPTGDLGKAGGLTWTYTGIQRGDLFHIYWVVCDDPTTPCGLSLDGAIDAVSEGWLISAPDTDFAAGKLVFTNTTHILLADASTPQLNGRLTVTIVDGSDAAIPFANVATLGVAARDGKYTAEIKGTGFKVVALTEVQDPSTSAWTPSTDYYDAAQTPETGATTTVSFGGSFYDE
jgi:hypothetical protein